MSADQVDPDDDFRRRLDEREILREAEEAAAQVERNTRTLGEVIGAAMLDGDLVVLEVGDVTVKGHPLSTSESLVQVQVGTAVRHVNLAAIAGVSVIPEKAPPVRTDGPSGLSLKGFLRDLVSRPPDGSIRLVTTSGQQWMGRVIGGADDHVELESDEGYLRACRLENVAFIEA
ncbi:MAG TPA: hypothetical protein VGC47_13495 [Acidimicrobiia bacterium]|jgi:hypothetical protein